MKKIPTVKSQQQSGKFDYELLLSIDPELCWFEGHFPKAAILPGVVQINWARQLARKLWPAQDWISRASAMETIKFQQVIRPGNEVQLSLSLDSVKRKLSFSYFAGDKKYSSGRLVLVS